MSPPFVIEKLEIERLVRNPLCTLGHSHGEAVLLTVVSGEMSVLEDRQRDIVIVHRQPLTPGKLALSCCDNRVTSPASRQHWQMAASAYWSHLSL